MALLRSRSLPVINSLLGREEESSELTESVGNKILRILKSNGTVFPI